MGKKARPSGGEPARAAERAAPFNNPFGELRGLRGELPSQATPREAPPAAPPRSGLDGCAKLVLQRERKGRAGKTVTRIAGLPAALLEETAGRLKAALGCGATLEAGDLILLGDLVDRAGAWLRGEGARQVVVSGRSEPGPAPLPQVAPSWREGSRRGDLEPGLTVDIVLKRDQGEGTLTRGVIQEILTPGATHPRGIKVRLTDGSVGRVKRVLEERR